MGYHIINIENGILKKDYVESYEELSYIDFITDNSVIYQGEEHWKPFKISNSEKYKHFSKGWFRAGIQAQELFKQQAIEHGFILEELNQDQNSFKLYTTNAQNKSIKRGDFLIRNFANIEIDVKCRGFRKNNIDSYFDFKHEDVLKHKNMMCFTNTPILIAVYENINNKPIEDNIYFFSIEELLNSNIEIYYRKGIGKCYRIPISFTKKGFSLITDTYNILIGKEKRTYNIESKKISHSNAYSKWTTEMDSQLKHLFSQKLSIKEISNKLERNNGAIRSRISKLQLKNSTPSSKFSPEQSE